MGLSAGEKSILDGTQARLSSWREAVRWDRECKRSIEEELREAAAVCNRLENWLPRHSDWEASADYRTGCAVRLERLKPRLRSATHTLSVSETELQRAEAEFRGLAERILAGRIAADHQLCLFVQGVLLSFLLDYDVAPHWEE